MILYFMEKFCFLFGSHNIFSYFCTIMVNQCRINWIDWAKVIAIFFVVFGHTPQERGDFLITYICTFHMPFFFMLSGFLSKGSTDTESNLRKHWHTLIIPYFFYNLIFYPYWLVRYLVDFHGELTFGNIVTKPLLGMLFFQIDSPVSTSLNGVTWFLAALLFMRIILNICYRMRWTDVCLIITALLFAVLHVLSGFYFAVENLFLNGLLFCFPFYVLGHFLRKKSMLERYVVRNNLVSACLFHALGLLLFVYGREHIGGGITYVLWAYLIVITASMAVIYTCRLLNQYSSNMLVNLSIGTIAIMGIHWMFIGTINFGLERLLGISDITYSWYVAILLSIVICFLIYPFIDCAVRYFPWALGKSK